MRIIIDKRESVLYEKCREFLSHQTFLFDLVIVQQELKIGDMLIQTQDGQDVVLIERKTFADLIASIKDGRYEEQSHRLLHTSELPPHSIIYLLEGMFSQVYQSKDKQMIYSSMTTLHYFKGCSVYRTSSVQETAEWLLYTAAKLNKELERKKPAYYNTDPFLTMFRKIREKSPQYMPQYATNELTTFPTTVTPESTEQNNENQSTAPANYCNFVKKTKKDNITPDNIGEIILCQIPGISSVTAITIMKQYKTFPNLISELQKDPHCLDGIACDTSSGKTRKISKACIENIRKFLL